MDRGGVVPGRKQDTAEGGVGSRDGGGEADGALEVAASGGEIATGVGGGSGFEGGGCLNEIGRGRSGMGLPWEREWRGD